MAYRSGMFNSVGGDRKYQALHFAEYFATFIGNGVFPNPSNGLQVYAKENMTVTIKPGKAWINGYYFVNDSDCDLALDISDGVLNRIDRIVLRFDTATRQIVPSVRKGAFSASPVAPAIQRDADGYEISLAQITVTKGTLAINQGAILDERLNNNVCGIVHGIVDQVDTTTLFNQYKAWLDSQIKLYENDLLAWTTDKKQEFEEWKVLRENDFNTWQMQEQQDFNDWFATIQGILDGDVATMLTGKVTNIEQKQAELADDLSEHALEETAHGIGDKTQLLTIEKTTLVGAVNELFTDVSDGKSLIANAITGKNGTANGSDSFSALASAISNIGGGVKSVQRGEITLKEKNSVTVNINRIVANNSFVKVSTKNVSDYSSKSTVRAKINGDSSVKIDCYAYPSATYPLNIIWEVIEFEKVKNKQSGETNNTIVDISKINPSKSFLAVSATTTSSYNSYADLVFYGGIINNTQLEFGSPTFGTATYSWQLLEFD